MFIRLQSPLLAHQSIVLVRAPRIFSYDDYNGFDIIGGCATGHFVHRVAPSGPASGAAGLQPGDHVLELNGVNFRRLTSEQAAAECARACERLTLRVQYNVMRYQQMMTQHHCDALYVRCLWDYSAEKDGELSFKKVRGISLV